MPDPILPPESGPGNRAVQGNDVIATRAAMRRAGIAAREALCASEHQRLSLAIETHLQRLLQLCQPRIVGFCWPIRGEFDCRPLAARLIEQGMRCCLPRVAEGEMTMTFHAWQPGSAMEIDRHGIHTPARGERLVPDLLLIPVNVFDAAGNRLGYGAGYFDRTLAALTPRPLTIGVGFELARCASIYPAWHDVPLDAVATESGIDIFSGRLPQRLPAE
jgi:5,10-methenyltetrahydrofolate synthetase